MPKTLTIDIEEESYKRGKEDGYNMWYKIWKYHWEQGKCVETASQIFVWFILFAIVLFILYKIF